MDEIADQYDDLLSSTYQQAVSSSSGRSRKALRCQKQLRGINPTQSYLPNVRTSRRNVWRSENRPVHSNESTVVGQRASYGRPEVPAPRMSIGHLSTDDLTVLLIIF